MSPHFLFRVENTALDPYQRATRLALFLWSRAPDQKLREAADNTAFGAEEMQQQAKRLLSSPRIDALTEGFASQWLGINTASLITPDPNTFPSFDEELRLSMFTETKRVFTEILQSNRPALDLLTHEFTFVDTRLAQHYKMAPPPGSGFTKVEAPDARRGLLTQGTVLSATSTPIRASVARRGDWILQNIMCSNVGQPPPGTDAAPEDAMPVEEQVAARMSSPGCQECHTQIDPLGLALNGYDAVGALHDEMATRRGTLPDGRIFDGPHQLATRLREDGTFARCLAEKLFTYAIGRPPHEADEMTLAHLASIVQDGASLREVIESLTGTDTFLGLAQ